LASREIFRHRRDGRYELSALADTLRSDADVSMAAMARWVGAAQHREHWSHLPEAVRTGRAVIPELRGKHDGGSRADRQSRAWDWFWRGCTATTRKTRNDGHRNRIREGKP
jgi:hypothetical protein